MTILCVTILSLGERGIRVFVWSMVEASASKSFEISGSSVQHREAMTTWGILALAVFVAVGMAEWSKRSAASEVVMDPKILEQAMASAAERKGIRGLGVSHGGNWERESGDFVKVKVNENERGVRKAESGNVVATIQTSAGGDR